MSNIGRDIYNIHLQMAPSICHAILGLAKKMLFSFLQQIQSNQKILAIITSLFSSSFTGCQMVPCGRGLWLVAGGVLQDLWGWGATI